MTDQIHIKDLLLRAIIGIKEDERRNLQDVLINITLYTDMRAAGRSDEIEDAVNYRTITKKIIKMVESSRFYLVERLSSEIAAICLEDPRVARVRVLLEKPGALRFARSVGVQIERTRADLLAQPNRVFIALGSNINPAYHMREAVQRLRADCTVLAVSPIYETTPVGKTDQPNFLNAAALVETDLDAVAFKAQVLQRIEQELGRVRTEDKNAPRTIDLDIVLFNDQVLDVEGRHIPEPDILRYPHLAVPLADLAPYQCHPETEQTLEAIAAALASQDLLSRTDLVL